MKKKFLFFTLPLIALSFLFSQKVTAVALCGNQLQPDDTCLEQKKITHVCEITDNCAGDAIASLAFSGGKELNIASAQVSGFVNFIQRPVASVDVDICTNNPGIGATSTFYVISDSTGSDWQRIKYHIFSFTKGKSDTVTFTPSGTKKNISKAVYNGTCKVTVSSQYGGPYYVSTDYSRAKTTVVETGVVSSSTCRSKVVNTDVYETNGDYFNMVQCNDNGTKSTYIGGSVAMSPVKSPTNSWNDMSVNVCTYLGVASSSVATLKAQGKGFYALTKLTAVWTYMTWPIFQFKWGVSSGIPSAILAAHSGSGSADWVWYYGMDKENIPSMAYDGQCTLTFRLYYYGNGTESWQSGYELTELGQVESATCKDPILVAPAPVAYWNATIENNAKTKKYVKIAPFFMGLSSCTTQSQCTYDYNWIDAATDDSCTATPDCSCSGRTEVCTVNGKATTTTANSPQCVLKASCSVESSVYGTSTTFTITPQNGIGNITYTNGANTVTQNKSDAYVSTIARQAGTQSINVNLKDAYDNAITNSSCYINNSAATTTPKIFLTKSPSVSLNKNGQCTLTWDIQDMPASTTCILSSSGNPENPSITQQIASTGTYTSGPLKSNQKYVITCSGANLSSPITASAICRVNPDIKEN